MHIEFIWINKYKRFREEGFNFSPQYQYTFEHSISKEKYLGELTWIKNENFIDDFFPDNIESLTAVVGKNGTGKSHVLEVIILVLEILNYNGLENSAKGHSYKPYSFIIVLAELSHRYLIKYNFGEIHCNSEIIVLNKDDEVLKKILKENFIIRYSNLIDNHDTGYKNLSIDPRYKDLTSNGMLKRTDSYQLYVYEEILREIESFYQLDIDINNFDFSIPDQLTLELELNDYLIKNKSLPLPMRKSLRLLLEKFKFSIDKIFKEERQKEDRLFKYMQNSIFLTIIFKFVENSLEDDSYSEGFPLKRIEDNKTWNNREYCKNNLTLEKIHLIDYDSFLKDFLLKIPHPKYDIKEMIDIIEEFFSKIDSLAGFNKITDVTTCKLPELSITINKNNFEKLVILLKNAKQIFKTSWYNMSSGEKSYLVFYSRFLNLKKPRNAIVLIDEIENTFHPQWQKEIMNRIIEFFKKHYSDTKLQIIITSNSPFLISDILPEHIIFMNKDYEQNQKYEYRCIVDKSKSSYNKSTFGSNIHTLLSDSFFMENGVMGEYANKIIQRILDYINHEPFQKETNEKVKKYINRIGERVIRNNLLYLLERKSNSNDKN